MENVRKLIAKLGTDEVAARDAARFTAREKAADIWMDITVVGIVKYAIENREDVGGRFTIY